MATAPTTTVVPEGPTLKDFFDHICYSNPFAQDRISDPSEADVDVPSIHQSQFDALVEHAQAAQREGRGVGVVLWGEAGVGKSHLLARFSRWAEEDHRACYVFLHNIHVDAERLPRYILKSVVSRLTSGRHRDFRLSRLYLLLRQIVESAVHRFSDHPQGKFARKELFGFFERYVNEYLDRKPRAPEADDETIYKILFQFFVSAHQAGQKKDNEKTAAAAVRWLSGDQLDETDAKRLAIKAEGGQDLACLQDDHAVERVLIALMDLWRLEGKAFILVFDQVENLKPDEIHALSRFSHTLIDHAPNLLVVTSGVQKELMEYVQNGVISQASWERIHQEILQLHRIRPTEARQLLEARIERFFESYYTLPPVKAALTRDTTFPLGENWLKNTLGEAPELKPRHVIGWAKQRWKEQVATLKQGGGETWLRDWPRDGVSPPPDPPLLPPEVIIDDKVDEKIREQIHRRELDRGSLPPDASNLCGLVRSLLGQCLQQDRGYSIQDVIVPPSRKKPKSPYDLLVAERAPDGRDVMTGLVFIVTGSRQASTIAIRHVWKDLSPPEHVIVVSDERQPLGFGKAGAGFFDELKLRGEDRFRTMQVSFEQYAMLDALAAVIGEARSGDLEATFAEGIRPLQEHEVIESHHRKDRYRSQPLLRELLCEGTGEDVIIKPPCPDDKELRQFIAAQLALTMGMSSIELSQKYVAKHASKGGMALEGVKVCLEAAALKMHEEELLNAAPTGGYLYLLNRPGR